MKKIPFSLISIALAVVFLVAGTVWAFTGPSEAPPACTSGNPGCDTPLNIGSSYQIKEGGIGVGSLTVDGGVVVNWDGGGGQPSCSSSFRGTLWFTQGTSGIQDTLEVCAKDGSDVYGWRVLY